MDVTIDAALMLCGLASAVFAAEPQPDRRQWWLAAGAGAGAMAALWWAGFTRASDVAATGIAVSFAAGILLIRPRRSALVAGVAAGASAGIWCELLRTVGAPGAIAMALAAAPLVVSRHLSASRLRFAPEAVREEALIMIVAMGLVVALMPGILNGWRTAVTLNIADSASTAPLVPAWTVAVVSASLAAGGSYAAWRHR